VVKLTELVSCRCQVNLFKLIDLEIVDMQKLVEILSLCENLFHSDSVDLWWEACLAIIDHQGIFENAKELVVSKS
jgi:hypothetical protein